MWPNCKTSARNYQCIFNLVIKQVLSCVQVPLENSTVHSSCVGTFPKQESSTNLGVKVGVDGQLTGSSKELESISY